METGPVVGIVREGEQRQHGLACALPERSFGRPPWIEGIPGVPWVPRPRREDVGHEGIDGISIPDQVGQVVGRAEDRKRPQRVQTQDLGQGAKPLRSAHEHNHGTARQKECGGDQKVEGLRLGHSRAGQHGSQQDAPAGRPGDHETKSRQGNGDGPKGEDVIRSHAQARIVEEDAGEEEGRSPGAADATSGQQALDQQGDARQSGQKEQELEMSRQDNALSQIESGQSEGPCVEPGGQVGLSAIKPPFRKGANPSGRHEALGHGQVVPTRIEGQILRNQNRQVDEKQPDDTEPCRQRRHNPRDRPRPHPVMREMGRDSARIAKTSRQANRQESAGNGPERGMAEPMANPNQKNRDGKQQHARREIQQEPLAQGQRTVLDQQPQCRVTHAHAGCAEKQHAAVDDSETPEQPLRQRLTLVQEQEGECHRARCDDEQSPRSQAANQRTRGLQKSGPEHAAECTPGRRQPDGPLIAN